MSGAFDESLLLSEASSVDGLTEFGDERFREPLKILLTSLTDAPLSDLGTSLLRSQVIRSLANLLRTHHWFSLHPQISEEVVAPAFVVVGMMRSGTTLVQRLLAQDPDTACVFGWEAMEPAPRLGIVASQPDPRIASAERREAQSQQYAPKLFAIHPSYAHEAEEEIMILSDVFLSHVPESYCHLPLYREWLDEQDFRPAYQHLYRTLQLLQWCKKRRGESCARWVLKTPAHLGYLDLVEETFPGAHLIHMHRDPRESIVSGASLNATLWQMHQDSVDAREVGKQWLRRMAWTNHRAMQFRDQRAGTDTGVTDVVFKDALKDPLVQMRSIYAQAGVEFTADAESAMRKWLQQDSHSNLPRHAYTAEDFGLTEALIEEQFDSYTRRFLRQAQAPTL